MEIYQTAFKLFTSKHTKPQTTMIYQEFWSAKFHPSKQTLKQGAIFF